MKTIQRTLLAASALALVGTAAPANAATFVLNGVNAITNQAARDGFLTAANYWAQTLTNNVTVVLNVNFTSLGTSPNGTTLGQTSSTSYSVFAGDVAALITDGQTSALDALAATSVASVLATDQVNFNRPGALTATGGIDTTKQVFDNDNTVNNQRVIGTGANLKALGYTGFTQPDGTITFNSDVAFDFNPTNGISSGTLDFVGVAIHEFGHALGFTSRTDVYDQFGCPKGPGCGTATGNSNFNTTTNGSLTVLDLFRYSSEGVRNVSPGQEVYFSVDGGVSELYGNANMSTGVYHGDGRQGSHWKAPARACDEPAYIGTMNPYLCSGQMSDVTATDLGAFDAIGWTLSAGARDNAAYNLSTAQIFNVFGVPEPATWLQLIIGFGVVGGSYRSARRRRAVLAAA